MALRKMLFRKFVSILVCRMHLFFSAHWNIAHASSCTSFFSSDTCIPTNSDSSCQVINGAITILLHGPITPNEDSLYLSKINSLFPLHLNGTNVSSMTYPEETSTTKTTKSTHANASSSTLSTFGITAAATAFLTIALFARGLTKHFTAVSSDGEEEEEYKGHDELTIAGTAEMTIVDDSSPKHHVGNEV